MQLSCVRIFHDSVAAHKPNISTFYHYHLRYTLKFIISLRNLRQSRTNDPRILSPFEFYIDESSMMTYCPVGAVQAIFGFGYPFEMHIILTSSPIFAYRNSS